MLLFLTRLDLMKNLYCKPLRSFISIKLILLLFVLIHFSCAVTHHKDKLINYRDTSNVSESLDLNGYYFTELERDANSNDSVKGKIKYLSVFFIYEDGFVVFLGGIDGITNYFCADNPVIENSYENAHRNVALMLNSQFSKNPRTKKVCNFKPNDISNKGLVKINDGEIKIQFYLVERQNPKKDSFNSYYLYELNGYVITKNSFKITSETNYRNNKTDSTLATYSFKPALVRPNMTNYFRDHNF